MRRCAKELCPPLPESETCLVSHLHTRNGIDRGLLPEAILSKLLPLLHPPLDGLCSVSKTAAKGLKGHPIHHTPLSRLHGPIGVGYSKHARYWILLFPLQPIQVTSRKIAFHGWFSFLASLFFT